MENWKAKDFVKYIDEKFLSAKKDKVSRMSVEWGQWSREMNIVLRDRVNSKTDPEELRLKHVIVYWTTKSQILEFNFKSKVLNSGRIKKRTKEADRIKREILTGKGLKEFELNSELTKKIMG